MHTQKIALAAVFISILSLSILSSVSNASALSAATVTSKPTFTSLNSGKWLNAWTNTGGTGTYFVDSSGANFKSVLLNNTGSIVSTASSALVGAPVTVTSLTGSTTRTDNIWKQDVGGTTQQLATASTTFVTEYVATASSGLVGQIVNSMTLYVKKTGSPTGTAKIGCFDSSGNDVITFGTQDVSLLTTSFVATTYTSTTAARTLANGDRCGAFFNGGTAGSATFDVEYDAANVYDGTTNTIVSTATGAQGAASWTSQTTREIRGTLSYVYGASNVNLATFSATELYENQGQIVRAIQSDDDSTDSLRSGSNTIIAEKAAASSTLIGSSTYDTMRLYLKKTGSPTGTATIGVFDSSGNLQATFGTQDVSLLSTSFVLKTYQSASAISIAANQYVGVQYSGGSVGNTLDIEYTASNPYDGTNSVLSRFTGAWADTSTADFNFKLSQEITGSASQESGANMVANFGSAQNVGGIYVYFPDATKIPSSIKLSTSPDNISYTDRVTLSPTQSTGAQYLTLDQTYNVQYVKLTVVTWGTAKSMQLGQFVRLPTATSSSVLSAIEDSGSVRSVFYAAFFSDGTSSNAYVGQINIDSGVVIAASTQTFGSSLNAPYSISVTKNKIYIDYSNGGWRHVSINRGLTGLSDTGASGTVNNAATCSVQTDGASSATDIMYCLANQSAAATIVYKLTGAGVATSLGTITGNAATDLEIINLSDKMIARATSGGTERTVSITKASDTLSSVLYTTDWTSYTLQQFDFTGSVARTFKTNTEAYYATSSYAIHYTPAGALTDPAEIYAETVNPATSTISNISGTLYRISNTLVISGSGTTWTPKTVSASTTFTPTAYTEKLTTPLYLNSSAIFNSNVIRLVCDANYVYPGAGSLYTGSDADCTQWRVLQTSSATVGRNIFQPFSESAQLVHVNPQTAYTFNLSATNPTIYTLKSLYGGKVIDVAEFDAAGTARQYYLYGQCYTIEVINDNTSETTNLGQICANDAFTKSINLETINVPQNWTDAGWHYNVTRTFGTGNVTTSNIIFDVKYNPTPYTARVLTTDSYLTNYQTFHTWYNFTNVNATSTVAITKPNNSTIYFIVYDNHDIPRLTVASHGRAVNLSALSLAFAPMGDLFGVPLTAFFVVLAAAIFVRSNSPFGTIVVGALASFMFATGLLSITAAAWGGIMVVIALGAIYAIRRQ